MTAIVAAVGFGVVVAANGGDGYDVGYAAGLALVPGLVSGAVLGGLGFFLRYPHGR
jgi:hypothetical protein